MYCPNCGAEYVVGITECSDCKIALVDELPEASPPPTPEYLEYQELLATNNPVDIALIRSVFDAENVKYYFLGELFYSMEPFVQPARLMVHNDHVETARDLLKGLVLRYNITVGDSPPSG